MEWSGNKSEKAIRHLGHQGAKAVRISGIGIGHFGRLQHILALF
jgi:hypothetical protein